MKASGATVFGGVLGGIIGYATGKPNGYENGYENGKERGIELAGGFEPSRSSTQVRSETQRVTVESGDHHAIHFTFPKETLFEYFVNAGGNIDIVFFPKQQYEKYQNGGDDPEYLVMFSDLDTSRANRTRVTNETGEFVLALDNSDYGRTGASGSEIDVQYSISAYQRTE